MNTSANIDAESRKDPARLEREIDQQRARISGIIDALEYQLAPRQLLDRAAGLTQDNGREFAQNLRETVQAHPVPALLTSVGLAWMYISRNDRPAGAARASWPSAQGDSSSVDDLKDGAKNLGDRLSDATDQARTSVHDAASHISESTSHARQAVREQGRWARDQFNQTLERNPLALGAVGVALGALVGALLPRTEQEDRMMGKASDRAANEMKQQARSAVEQARETVASSTETDDSASAAAPKTSTD